MHSSQLPAASSQPSDPPLPSAVPPNASLPPLPPEPSLPSEPQTKVDLLNHRSRPPNASRKHTMSATSYLAPFPSIPVGTVSPCIVQAPEQFGVELPFPSPFGMQDDLLPHMFAQHAGFKFPYASAPSAAGPFIQGFQYFSVNNHSPLSVPPPMFPVPQANFNFPPPLLKQPPSSFGPPLKVGIPFPPPGYDSNVHSAQQETSCHDIDGSRSSRNSRSSCHPTRSRSQSTRSTSQSTRSRSKSPSRFSTKSSSKHSRSTITRQRSRSRSRSTRRSQSRSRTDVYSRSRIESSRYSTSRSQRKRSTTPRKSLRRSRSTSRSTVRSSDKTRRRSRSASRSTRRSRSIDRSLRRSRSPSRLKRRSRSNTRTVRRSESPIRRHISSRHESRGSLRSRSPNRSPKSMKTENGNQDLFSGAVTSDFSVKNDGADKSSFNVAKDEDEDLKGIEGQRERSGGNKSSKTSHKIRESRMNGDTHLSHREQSKSERETLVERWRLNNCKNLEEMANKLQVLSRMEADDIIELEKQTWTRSAPADLYYKRHPNFPNLMEATPKLLELCDQFDAELVQRAERERKKFPPYNPPPRKIRLKPCRHKKEGNSSSSSSSCDDSSSDEEDKAMMELEKKRKHPQRLHPELWHNEQGEMNDGPLCRCSHRARQSGIRHNVYLGEQKLEKCSINTNNAGKLHHYRITMSPPVNFLTKTPTIIEHDNHEYIFEGFSMLSHFPLVKLPTCKVIRFNIEYTILYVDEAMPENFTIRELDLFYNYLFHEILELLDLDLRAFGDPGGCNQFHFMPRFVRDLPENGKEILSMNEVLKYLLKSNKPLVPEDRLNEIYNMSLYDWQIFADEIKCMVVTKPGTKPASLRVDQLDRETMDEGRFPEIVHFGIRPPQLSYAGNTEYQKHWREYVKFRHLLANMSKPSPEDKRKLMGKESRLQEMRTVTKMKRDVTIALSSEGFYRTGIMCDIIQHALLLPVLVCHLRFHKSLDQLEEDMGYKFKNRYLLQLALTHPSYRENFGTNPDHARNSLTNCGIRQPEYGDRRIHYMNTRKRGINTLIQIMSRFGKREATESNIGHNERLEFLGDAVVEFITSIHLFHLFPDLEEGGLATYRAAIVQNQHLAVMAKRLRLDAYMLYAHGSDLCHDLELRHAMANCFEALMGALFLDGGIEVADKVFGFTLWKENTNLTDIWMNYPLHPLQEQEPAGDRQWIQHFPVLQKLTEFEAKTGIVFKHIRLLARAFTDRSVGYTNLTLGSNQRLEFLGDTVLQIIASEYLYKFFPEHHEGHLSLLRSSLVNNRTQAVVCDDLGMTDFALYANPKHDIKTKDRADLLEAYLGALYIDKGLKHCHVFCEICFFPRLQDFIMNQDWNDPKSKLQQCCLTLRTMEGGEPDIPVYKVIQCMGPTNTRIYTVAVYFRGERLAQASGHSIQQAEMNAANEALELSTELFPQLDHQRRVIAKSMKKQKKRARREAALKAARDIEMRATDDRNRDRDRDRNRDRVGVREKEKDRNRDRVRERDKDRERDRHRERNREKERSRDRERGRDAERNRHKERCRDNEKGRDKERSRERVGDKVRIRERERTRNVNGDRERSCLNHDQPDRCSNRPTEDREEDRGRSNSIGKNQHKKGLSRDREVQGGRSQENERHSTETRSSSGRSLRTNDQFIRNKDDKYSDNGDSDEIKGEFLNLQETFEDSEIYREKNSSKVLLSDGIRQEKWYEDVQEPISMCSTGNEHNIHWFGSPENTRAQSVCSDGSISNRSDTPLYHSVEQDGSTDSDSSSYSINNSFGSDSSGSSKSFIRSNSVYPTDDLSAIIVDQACSNYSDPRSNSSTKEKVPDDVDWPEEEEQDETMQTKCDYFNREEMMTDDETNSD